MTIQSTLAMSGDFTKILTKSNAVLQVQERWTTCQVHGPYHQNNLELSLLLLPLLLLMLLLQNSIL